MVAPQSPCSVTASLSASRIFDTSFISKNNPNRKKGGRRSREGVLLGYSLSKETRIPGLLYSSFDFIGRGHCSCGIPDKSRRVADKSRRVASFDLFDLARKTASTFTLSSENSDIHPPGDSLAGNVFPESDLKQVNKCVEDNRQAINRKPHFNQNNLVLVAHKGRLSLPVSRFKIWRLLGGRAQGLDAAPLAPLPPFTGSLITLLGFVLVLGVLVDRWIGHTSKGFHSSNEGNGKVQMSTQPKAPTGLSVLLEQDFKKKESVEWVNMVLGKLWKVYRLGLERWLVGLLQPLIDDLQKPSYVERVQIKQFYLGDEPISVRSVERRASRRVNDLQYHIGLRYTGSARMLLLLKLRAGFIPLMIPVGVRGLDVDGELWVKLRLVPCEPWVGTATWAFVSLPKIKLDLSPFRLFNLMAIPFLSIFLTKLLTQDLPRLFVRPKKIVIDFLKGKTVRPVLKEGATIEGNKDFSGELSVTLVDAIKLSYVPYSKTDPYVVFILGDQVVRSKKNSQTSVIGPPGGPIWNQDFQLLVVDPKTQRLAIRVRDHFGLAVFTVGSGEVELSALKDTVPADRVVQLSAGWGLFGKRFAGEVLLRLTYTAYVEDEDENRRGDALLADLPSGYSTEADEKPDPLVDLLVNKTANSLEGQSSIADMFAAAIAELNEENNRDSQGKLAQKSWEASEDDDSNKQAANGILESVAQRPDLASSESETDSERRVEGSVLLWLGLLTGLALLVAFGLDFSDLMNP